MPAVEHPLLKAPVADPHLPAARERVREAIAELKRLAILDADGNRTRKDLPTDMQPGVGAEQLCVRNDTAVNNYFSTSESRPRGRVHSRDALYSA